ncbi:uncharacterized protein G2W53_018344 [Senna tora]|uniref:Uncharacterized protein n=1 Tax=Senna tora TaxID=362788 RepID=A0A834WKZ8_9FABA|nr:uncharacterized protein G2W53_018336 [Senna tora]KAF7827180.1 uncharacterized protein G2W53_018344 [Senna tora]
MSRETRSNRWRCVLMNMRIEKGQRPPEPLTEHHGGGEGSRAPLSTFFVCTIPLKK